MLRARNIGYSVLLMAVLASGRASFSNFYNNKKKHTKNNVLSQRVGYFTTYVAQNKKWARSVFILNSLANHDYLKVPCLVQLGGKEKRKQWKMVIIILVGLIH